FIDLSLDGRAAWLGFRRNGREEVDANESHARFVLTVVGSLSSLPTAEERSHGRTLMEFARRFGPQIEVSPTDCSDEADDLASPRLFNSDLWGAAVNLISSELVRTSNFEREVS